MGVSLQPPGSGPYAAPAIPEGFGAVGDGTTDDTIALRAAIASLKNLWLTPGKTYLVSGALTLNDAQVVHGNGAWIKRAAQVSTTTATPATGGQTVFTFASAAAFKVGMNVAFADAGVAQSALVAGTSVSTNNPQITGIVGNVVTVSPAPNSTIAGSANVYANFDTIVLGNDCKVQNLRIDGNRANIAWGRWECTNEFYSPTKSRIVVQGCYVKNSPGEGAVVNGSYITYRDCTFDTLSGNGIHFSGATHPLVDGCTVINPNQDTNVGHVMGCVGWSDTISDATVTNCYLSGGVAGIGKVDSADNSDVTISNNTIRGATTSGIDLVAAAGNLVIIGNRIYACGSGTTGGINIGTGTATGIQIANNLFSANSVNVNQTNDVQILNNQFLASSNLTLTSLTAGKVAGNTFVAGTVRFSNCVALTIENNLLDYTGNTATNPLATAGTGNTDCTIRGNTIIGGARGIDIASGTSFTIIGNSCVGQNANGIFISGTGGFPNTVILNNYVATTANSAASWLGIRCSGNTVTIKGNHVTNTRGSGNANYGIYISDKCVVDGNRVVGAWGLASINITAASTNSTVCNNVTDSAVVDAGTTTQLVNNTVIS